MSKREGQPHFTDPCARWERKWMTPPTKQIIATFRNGAPTPQRKAKILKWIKTGSAADIPDDMLPPSPIEAVSYAAQHQLNKAIDVAAFEEELLGAMGEGDAVATSDVPLAALVAGDDELGSQREGSLAVGDDSGMDTDSVR
ncbi:hypothetical protein SeMB42_g02269 [Synchytrium endobioticum]|uniref:Uncharacterized protein n=1 Tax=Synchytrium endobioticum TaxID=286115 RepID=A0A507DFQ5_9FUNG|nr:hypothetical protein SeLEV6574_g02638 [Synchytrium endobioticum]TPX50394.1 hypothetical protein SeMB42_g02269 [Synchytrium endobioticum]